jgi:hypothetical protein
MHGQQSSKRKPSPLVRNYAEEVVEAYLARTADDSTCATEVAELYANGDVIAAAARIVSSGETDWRV